MRFILALCLPPVAVLSCGKWFQAVLNIPLTLLFIAPGVIHALYVVGSYHAEQRNQKLIRAIAKGR